MCDRSEKAQPGNSIPGIGRSFGLAEQAQTGPILTAHDEAMRDAARGAYEEAKSCERVPITRRALEERREQLRCQHNALSEKLSLLDQLISLFR